MFLVWSPLFSRWGNFQQLQCNTFTTPHKKPNNLSCVDILLKSVISFEIYIRFCIFWVQEMSLPAIFSILMPRKWSWRNGKLMLLWYITKLIYQENWPLQPFYFAVILKVISCRFTCQNLVRFDRIDFFLSDFKVSN